MSRNAAMEGDGHSCPTHGLGAVLPPSAQHVLVGDSVPVARVSRAVRIGDTASCPTAHPEHVTQGTAETLIEGRGAARVMDLMEHGGLIYGGAAYVIIGKVLSVRIVIVKGTCWDSADGHAEIEKQVATAEGVIGMRVVTGPYETQNLPGALNMQHGAWNATNHYSPQLVGQINTLSTAGRPAMLFTNAIVPNNLRVAGITASPAFAAPADGLTQSGVVFGCSAKQPGHRVMAHECGHMLSRLGGNQMHDLVNRNNVMWPFVNQQGSSWMDPWASAAEGNGMLR